MESILGIDFRWHSGDSAIVAPYVAPAARPNARPRRRGLWPLGAFLALLLLAGLVAWRAQQGQRAARADLQRLVEQEVTALQARQLDLFLSFLDGTPLPWRHYHEANFPREAAWYAARAGARPLVQSVRLEGERAVAEVLLTDGRHSWRGTWYFQRLDGRWRHTAPPAEFWGATQTLEAPHLSLSAADPDRALLAALAADLERLYGQLMPAYGLVPPPAAAEPDFRPLPGHITIDITPDVVSMVVRLSVRDRRWYLQFPSPHLALELWTPEEATSSLDCEIRTTLARTALGVAAQESRSEPEWLLEGLALWHARAWRPEWERSVRASLADGSAACFLDLWTEPQTEPCPQQIRSRMSPEQSFEWTEALLYTVGEYLGSHYPPARLSSLVHAAGQYPSIWDACEAELGLSRAEFQAAWLAYLQEGYGTVN